LRTRSSGVNFEKQRHLAVIINIIPNRRNEFIALQKAKVRIAFLPVLDVKTRWNSTLELLERAYRPREFSQEWLKNPKYAEYRALCTTEDEWTIVQYVMEVLRPFRYWTLWMSKRQTVTLHHVITVYNDMFDRMDGVLRALIKKKTPLKRDVYISLRSARRKLSKYYATVTPKTGVLLIIARLLDPYWKLRTFVKWDKAMDVAPDEDHPYTNQYKETFIKYVENEYCQSRGKTQQSAVNKSDQVFGGSSSSPDDISDDSEAARVEAWEGKDSGGVRVLLANSRWERRFVKFLELSGVGRTMADGADENGARATRMDEWMNAASPTR
jgi:hypothetical protein